MRRTKWRRVISVLLVFVSVAGIFSACSNGKEQESMKLSELSDEALLQRLEAENISVPQGLSISEVREMIVALEADPDHALLEYSAPHMVALADALRIMVKNITP